MNNTSVFEPSLHFVTRVLAPVVRTDNFDLAALLAFDLGDEITSLRAGGAFLIGEIEKDEMRVRVGVRREVMLARDRRSFHVARVGVDEVTWMVGTGLGRGVGCDGEGRVSSL